MTEKNIPKKNITVQYFAILREQRGCPEETLVTTAKTPADLYSELQTRHGFTLPGKLLKVSVNNRFCDWSTPLSERDAVVFIPPVAGG